MANRQLIDYKKIKLENERSSDLTKRLNRNTGWQFMKILYRDSMFKILGANFLMLMFAAPIFIALYYFITTQTLALTTGLPTDSFLWIGNSVWLDVASYTNANIDVINRTGAVWMSLAAIFLSFVFSGGFAVIRNSYWTGKLDVIRTFSKGIGQSIAYTLPGTIILSGLFLGIYLLAQILFTLMPYWVFIIVMIAIWAVYALIFTYMFTLFAVAVTYKQSYGQNIADAWRLMWMNFLPNIIRIVLTAMPIGLYALLAPSGGILPSLLLAAMFMFGMFYIVYVYMVHMMRTFALFHPVQPTKKQ